MLLVKNPAGRERGRAHARRRARARRSRSSRSTTTIADGRDVSWIWDVDFEPLARRPRPPRRHRHAGRRARAALRLRRPRARPDRGRPVARGGARPRPRADACGRRAGGAPDLHRDARAPRSIVAGRGHVDELLGERGMRIRVGHLYPDYLNIYADRGNIAVLAERARLRGHELDVRAIGMGDARSGGRDRPLLRRRRPGPRAGAGRARPRREGRAAPRGRRGGSGVSRRLRRLPAARPLLPRRRRRRAAGHRPAAAAHGRRASGG